jgi:cytochrome d ubiquinol oxidase subunit II
MPGLYLPIIIMLLALVFRGVAFEFHVVAGPQKHHWHTAFWLGSTVAAFFQGVILAGLLQGLPSKDGAFTGGPLDWATPFAVLCGLGVVIGYALLGATWLVMKVEGPVAVRARQHAKSLIPVVLVFMAAVSLWTPLAFDSIAQRWFSRPNIYYLWPVPLLTALLAYAAWRWLEAGREVPPFFAAMGLFLLGFIGLAISIFPNIVPPSLTIWQAAAAPDSQFFMLAGTLVLLPMIIGYVIFVYWTFRSKVAEGSSYH